MPKKGCQICNQWLLDCQHPQSSGDLNAVDVSVEVDGARFSWLQYTIQVMSMHHLLGAIR